MGAECGARRRGVPGGAVVTGEGRLHVGVNLLWLVPGVVGGSEEYTTRLLARAGRARPRERRDRDHVVRPSAVRRCLCRTGPLVPHRRVSDLRRLERSASRGGVDMARRACAPPPRRPRAPRRGNDPIASCDPVGPDDPRPATTADARQLQRSQGAVPPPPTTGIRAARAVDRVAVGVLRAGRSRISSMSRPTAR